MNWDITQWKNWEEGGDDLKNLSFRIEHFKAEEFRTLMISKYSYDNYTQWSIIIKIQMDIFELSLKLLSPTH